MDIVKCPKAGKCIMDCYHRNEHVYEEKHCNDIHGQCNVQCVHVLIHDCIFFDEDFLI